MLAIGLNPCHGCKFRCRTPAPRGQILPPVMETTPPFFCSGIVRCFFCAETASGARRFFHVICGISCSHPPFCLYGALAWDVLPSVCCRRLFMLYAQRSCLLCLHFNRPCSTDVGRSAFSLAALALTGSVPESLGGCHPQKGGEAMGSEDYKTASAADAAE